jgi:putative RNA 2'-phosphotransferase
MMLKNSDISRTMSHALRHEPWLYELELDEDGWASVDMLAEALQQARHEWRSASRKDIARVIEQAEKKRHELVGDRVRALYGHSFPGKLRKEAAVPPPLLFHGTSADAVDDIRKTGLLPMGRQYVHLSPERDLAVEVGKRKATSLAILAVDAASAYEDKIVFYIGNENVWLADNVPATFLLGTSPNFLLLPSNPVDAAAPFVEQGI